MNSEGFPTIRYAVEQGVIRRNIDWILGEGLPITEDDPGMNCQLYTALLIRAMGYDIPDYYRSSEWFYDPEERLLSINYPTEAMCDGDVVGFAGPNEMDMTKLHIGVVRINSDGIIEVLHASRRAEKVIVTPLHEMPREAKHEILYMVKRPKPKFKTRPFNQEALAALGWFHKFSDMIEV